MFLINKYGNNKVEVQNENENKELKIDANIPYQDIIRDNEHKN